ncbi:MAG: hypothetical protein FWG33_04465 [Oscillospiraceae bacterium]|nr:hypothetical protein [Oscillospiraceae bacterium]
MIDDKRELLKLKQGLVSAEESPLEVDENPEPPKLIGKAALSNFVYHHSLHLKIAGFFLVIGGIFAFFILTAEKHDITILLIADNQEASVFFGIYSARLKKEIEQYTPDFNGNGKVSVECRLIDLVTHVGEIERNPNALQGNMVKLIGEVLTGNSLIYIGNKEALENILGEDMSIEDFYYAFHSMKDTVLEVDSPDDLYIAVRNSGNEKEFSKALTVFSVLFSLTD